MISKADLAALTTHAATASSAAADDNKRREREAWAQFDEVVERVMRPCTCHPADNPPVPCAKKYALGECTAKAPEA